MKKELMKSSIENRKFSIDPRTKLLLLVMIAVFVLGEAGGSRMMVFQIILSIIPLSLLLIAGRMKECAIYFVFFIAGYLSLRFLLPITSGVLNYLILAVGGMLTKFLPGIMTGIYVLSTTTVSEFVAAMERMHVTDKITIPMSVMFRFFPTVGEEYAAINAAMSMRDIRFGGGNVSKILEYRLVPMMTCSVKIGEELSAAALTRGLGAPVKRTNICKIGFHVQDVGFILICLITVLFWIIGLL